MISNFHNFCDRATSDEFSKRAQSIFNMINYGRADSDKNATDLSFSQFCMAAMNETVLVNTDKVERAFNLFDIVSQPLQSYILFNS